MTKKSPGSKAEEIAPEFEDLIPSPEESKDEAIIRLRKEGRGYRDIQRELGVGQGRIAEVLKKAGLLGEQRRREEAKKATLLFDEELIGSFIELPFDYFAKRYGDFWKLSSDEKKKLTILTNKVSSKYLPLWLERFADEVALIATFSMVVYPRWLQTKKTIEEEKEKGKPSGPGSEKSNLTSTRADLS